MRTFAPSAIRQTPRSSWRAAWTFVREQKGAATMNTAAGVAALRIYQRREDSCAQQTHPENARALAAWYLAAVRIGSRRIGILRGALQTSIGGLQLATQQRARGCWQHLPV